MIPTLSSDAFAGQLREPHPHGVSPLFRGRIKLDDETIKCYIKPMPDQIVLDGRRVVENREILNEALGYTLAKSAGYSVPRHAGIIMLNAQQIPESTRRSLAQLMPRGHTQSDYLAWFSEDMMHPSLLRHVDTTLPIQLQQRQISVLAKKLAKHSDSPAVVTFDDWTENSDRNIGNLLERSDGGLSLIDHGRIFRSSIWSPGSLSSNPVAVHNKIRQMIDGCEHGWSERPATKSARLLAYNNLAATWRSQGAAAARSVLQQFLEDAEVDMVVDFLADRLDPPKYKKAVGLLV